MLNEQTAARLATMPVSALKGSVPRGTRLGVVESAGFRTVGSVRASSPAALARIQGIGVGSASEIYSAAAKAAAAVRDGEVLRFDVNERPPAQTALLATLIGIRQADAAVPPLREPAEHLAGRLQPLTVATVRATSKFKMVFTGGATKRATLTALGDLSAALQDPAVIGLHGALTGTLRAIHPDLADFDPWAEYRRDASAINSLLQSLFGITAPGDVEDASFGSIPDRQIRRTRAVDLNTSLMRSALRGYQVFGAQYALLQKNSIIGDEMGLGKSIQAIAVAAHLAAQGETRTLVICPTSVIINWRNEIVKHSRLDAYLLHGPDRDEATAEWLDRARVGVTTFGTIGQLPLPAGTRFAFVVVDEAHLVKNPTSQRSQVVRRMLNAAGRTALLTGTPMENRVEESGPSSATRTGSSPNDSTWGTPR